MTYINQLSTAAPLNASDQVPLYSSPNGDARKTSLTALAAFLQTLLAAPGVPATQYASPNATGFTVTIAPASTGASVWLLLTPVAGYAAGTIVLPAGVDGQEVRVSCTQAVTTLTVSGGTINGAPTTLAANGFFSLRYDGVNASWYRTA